jgi:hypothetical protein
MFSRRGIEAKGRQMRAATRTKTTVQVPWREMALKAVEIPVRGDNC